MALEKLLMKRVIQHHSEEALGIKYGGKFHTTTEPKGLLIAIVTNTIERYRPNTTEEEAARVETYALKGWARSWYNCKLFPLSYWDLHLTESAATKPFSSRKAPRTFSFSVNLP